LAQLTGHAVHIRQASSPYQFLSQVLQRTAFLLGFIICALYLLHRRSHEPRLDIARIGVQHGRQIRQGEIELMHPLTQRSAQDQHFLGCSLEAPPRGERRLGIAGVTWITRDAAQLRVALRDQDRQRQIVLYASQLIVQCT
jgi:hypothetical protein